MPTRKPLLGKLRLLGFTKARLWAIGLGLVAVLLLSVTSRWRTPSPSREAPAPAPPPRALQESHQAADAPSPVVSVELPLKPNQIVPLFRQIYGAEAERIHHGDAMDAQEREEMGDAAVYGEILPVGLSELFAELGGLGPEDVFVDLGSGTGKVPIQAHLETAVGVSIGVELGKLRHKKAEAAVAALQRLGYRDHQRLLSVMQGDALKELDAWGHSSVVFMNSLRFPAWLLCGLQQAFQARLAPGSIVISSKPLLGCQNCCRELKMLRLKASWHDKVKAFIYAIPPPPLLGPNSIPKIPPWKTREDLRSSIAAPATEGVTWPSSPHKSAGRLALLGSTSAVEWTLSALVGIEFSPAACSLRDVSECIVEPQVALDVGELHPTGKVFPAGAVSLLDSAAVPSGGTVVVVGSAEGEVPLYIALSSESSLNILGIEPAEPRHQRAQLALEELQRKGLIHGTTTVRFVKAADLEKCAVCSEHEQPEWRVADAAMLLSAFWPPADLIRLMPSLRQLPACSRVVTMQPFPGCHVGLIESGEGLASVSWFEDGAQVWHYVVVPRRPFALKADGTVAGLEALQEAPCQGLPSIASSSMSSIQVAQCAVSDAVPLAPAIPDGCGIWRAGDLRQLVETLRGFAIGTGVVFLGPGWHHAAFFVSMIWQVHVRLQAVTEEYVAFAEGLQKALADAGVLDPSRPVEIVKEGAVPPGTTVVFAEASWVQRSHWKAPQGVSIVLCCDSHGRWPHTDPGGDAGNWMASSGLESSSVKAIQVMNTCSRDEGSDFDERRAMAYVYQSAK